MSGHDAALEQRAEDLAGRADDADRAPVARRARLLGLAQRGVEVGRDEVEVALLDAALEVVRVDVDDEADAVEHRHGQRLRAAHAAAAGGQHDAPAQASRRSACARPPRTSRTCPAGCPACRCRSTTRPSSGRTSSGPRPRAAGTSPSRPSRARAGCWRSARAAPSRACGRRRPACRSARAASRRSRGGAAWRRSRGTPPTSARRARCRRRRRGWRDPPRPRGRGCS